jgi:uncharacterized protein (DUF2147 family)
MKWKHLGAQVRACILTIAAFLPLAASPATPQSAVAGTWLTEDGGSKVEIAPATGADGSTVVSGKVVWLKEPTRDGKPVLDANNGDAALRGRPIMGLEILSGFKPAAGGAWAGGTVYSPRSGKSFPAELSLAADGRLQIKVKAGVVSRTLFWTR